jgi:hypothetical protein
MLSIYLFLPLALGPVFTQSVTEKNNRNSKEVILGSREEPIRIADNLAAICEPLVYTMSYPQHLTTLSASTIALLPYM